MKKMMSGLVVGVLLASAARSAVAFTIGLHGAVPGGGDVNDASFGFGLHAEGDVNETVSIEISGTGFGDDTIVPVTAAAPDGDDTAEATGTDIAMDMEVTSVSISALFNAKMGENARVYGGIGLEYNIFSASVDILEWSASQQDTTVQEMIDELGITIEELQDFVVETGSAVDVALDDSIGYLVCVGGSFNVNERVQVFGQYRYNWGAIEGDVITTAYGYPDFLIGSVDQSYDFGLLVFGVSMLL